MSCSGDKRGRCVSYADEEYHDEHLVRRKLHSTTELTFQTPAAQRHHAVMRPEHMSAEHTVRSSRLTEGGGREDTDLGFPYTSVHLDLCSVRIADNVHGPVVWSEGRENGKGHASLLGVRADAGNVLSHATNMVAETDKLRFDETAAFAFRRLGHRPLKTGFRAIDEALDGVGLAYPAVLELVGHSGSGKTEFFLNICAVNILPENFEGVFLGGPGQSFVYFCVGMIPSTMITRLITLLDVVLAQACPQSRKRAKGEGSDVRDWVRWRNGVMADCLSRLLVVPCSNAVEFLCSVRNLPTLLRHTPGIRAIVLDCLSTLQWFDKTSARGHSDLTPSMLIDCALGVVHAVAQEYRLILLGSRWAGSVNVQWRSINSTPSSSYHRLDQQSISDPHADAFGKRWYKMVTHRLYLSAAVHSGRVHHSAIVKKRELSERLRVVNLENLQDAFERQTSI